jgi:hypothetical protein
LADLGLHAIQTTASPAGRKTIPSMPWLPSMPWA